MLKILTMLKRTSLTHDAAEMPPDWQRDPLQHPDLARMEERELADLPFPGWPWPRAAPDHCDCV
ncbi:hypothetical protein QN224_04610 [Sinorhizobium sp. 8-89]|uniref:hypothetical protein n=1 Tax=Sinorhizobium sp. 7-81 TaxID=3049087 RepID=UPI0024C40AEA|nr:hypothetical protein [Sinorhizobium sp. 7-81]MDK1384687.1 hypothetical protein [Sinorhizobium sp. 7-81]